MFNQRYGYHRPIRNQRSHNFSTNFAPQVCLLIKMKICGMLWKSCLIADTAIAEPLATRVRLLRHLQLAMYTDVHIVRHKHHRVARFWVGGETRAQGRRAVYASAAYGRRRRTTHRINVITAKSRERGKKVTKGRQGGRKGQGRPSTGPRGWKSVDICINQELMTKPSTTIQRMLVDIAVVPLHLIPMIYLEINASW